MPPTEPAELLELNAGHCGLQLLLAAGGDRLRVDIDVPPATGRALHHLIALHGHQRGCPAAAPSVLVDLLCRCIGAQDRTPALIVRVGQAPGFWLRPDLGQDGCDLDVNVLDAFCLLASQRFPLLLERGSPPRGWDRALRDLLSDS
jgi:hypothetical protein